MKKSVITGQQMLIRSLINYFGGPTKMARIIGILNGEKVTLQLPLNWVMRGRVPIEVVGEVSRKLKVDRFALNFEQCGDFLGHTPLWEEVIEALPLPAASKQKILKLPKPKESTLSETFKSINSPEYSPFFPARSSPI